MSTGQHDAGQWLGVIRQYRSYLPVGEATPVISLLEGNTPLVRVPNFVEAINGQFELYLKYEGLNPTCSFKDRGMTLAVSKAKENGAQIIVCASTGNTSAAAAAYAARANLKSVVLIPEGSIALGKLAQSLMYGAQTLQVQGNFDHALEIVRQLGETGAVEVVNSINPIRIEGQKTAAFEICDALGDAPDMHFLPVGNAGNITAYWKGYREYQEAGKSDTLPRMMGFQASGAAPIVDDAPVENPQTIASAIRIGNPASWQPAKAALQFSGGAIDKVTDEEILAAHKLVASKEGIFIEPASATALAGIIKEHQAGGLPEGSLVVATMTGHGLKDPENAVANAGVEPVTIPAELDAVKAVIGL